MAHDQVKARRAYRALNAARTISETLTDSKGEPIWGVRSQLEYIDLHIHGYAEKGYSDPECGIIAVGNWNNVTRYNRETQQTETTSTLPSRLLRVFEKLGIECEWSDEFTTCDDCAGLLRTHPDCMSWEPSYVASLIDKGECVCLECHDPDE